MFNDADVKIAGNRPSVDVKRNIELNKETEHKTAGNKEKAVMLGRNIALIFAKDTANFNIDDESDYEMIIQRRLLLSFTATVGFEEQCSNDSDSGIAQKSFLDTLQKVSPEIYKTSSDTGAFSFYFLAYRRGIDIVRRIGQTFAMLCMHDGDSVYQELGEALYCWFSSVVKEEAEKLNL